MAYTFQVPNSIGASPVATIDDSARHVLGTIMPASDPIFGGAEFIYLKGVASTVAGSAVVYDSSGVNPTYQTALSPNTANLGQPIAIASAAIVANKFGWYQISGVATVQTTGVSAQSAVGLGATPGQLTASSAGKEIENARALSATSSGSSSVQINRPFAQGRIT